MKRFISVLLVIALLVPMLCVDVFAESKTVYNFADLKDAIAQAQDDDVITVNGDITITETLKITKNITIKSDGTKTLTSGSLMMDSIEGCNMFYVPDGKTLSLENITLDGDNKCRLIRAKGAKLNLTNVIMKNGSTEKVEKNSQTDQVYSGGAIYAEGSIVTIKGGSFENNNTGTRALDGSRAAEGGAIKLYKSELYINDETTTVKDTTKFTGNHLDGWETTGGRQGGSIEATESKVEIYGTTFDIVGPFNTGGAIKFEDCGTETEKVKVINSSFTIVDGKKPVGMAGGAITSEGSHLLIDNSTFKTGKESYVQESGGLIQVVGTGTFDLKNSTLTGSGYGWNKSGKFKTAKYGGAIVFYDDSTVKATIENTTIKNFTAEISGGAIALNTQVGKSGGTNLTLKDTKILNNLAYAFDMTAYGGGVFVGKGNTVTIEGGEISSKDQYLDVDDNKSDFATSSVGGAIYNEGKLTLTGTKDNPAKIINNKAYHMAAGVLNDGYLKVDYAKFEDNKKGDWSNANQHVYKKEEMAGENIYAVKDVIITPNATFDGKDVRILDGQSKIILTGELPEKINDVTKKKESFVNVSISENPKQQGNDTLNNPAYPIHPKFNETQKRKVGYLVAVGDGTYQATAEDAKQIHYVSKDTSQAIAEFGDHESTGKWDFVLNPKTKQVVLGQRVKLTLHANGLQKTPAKFEDVKTGRNEDEGILTKLPSEDKKEDIYDIYTEGEKSAILSPEPIRKGYAFTGWYKEAKVNDNAPDENKSGKTQVKEQKLVKDSNEITSIIDPNKYELYAGWEKVVKVKKIWDDNNDEFSNRPDNIKVKLYSGGTLVGREIELNAGNNWEGEFRNIRTPKRVLPYTVKEFPGQVKGYKTGEVTGNDIDGFTVTNETEYITIEGSKTWEHGENPVDKQPTKVTVKLSDGEKEESKTVGANDNWSWKFEKLPKYKNKTLVNYILTENTVKNYASTKSADGYSFTNTFTNKYKVTYEFKPEESSKTLPQGVTDQLPGNDIDKENGSTVTPSKSSFKDVTDGDGTWSFKSWDANSKTIDKADVKFIGTWTFAETPKTKYKATYEFKSGTEGKDLPAAIEGYKPTDNTEYADGATVNAQQPTQTSYEAEDGTWTFTSWDKQTDTIKGSDVLFTGTWTFTKKPEPKSDFTITKSVDKATYKKAGEVLTYTITVTNTGKKDLTGLKLTDQLVNVTDKPFELAKGASKTFTYTYTITEADVKAKSVTNVASVTLGKDSKEATAKSILKEKEKRGDVYVRYETEDGKILDEFAVLIDAPVGTYYYTEEKAFPRYRFVGLAPYSDPAEGYVVEGTQYVVYLYRRDRGGRTPDRRDRYEREEKEVEEPVVEAKRKPELNKKDHKQYMYGYPDWTFVPAANITRGEAAAMFARLFKEYPGLDYNYKKYYTDVDESYWGFKEVAYLSEFGILSGYSDGTFRPNNKITRAEFVKIAESFEALTWGLSPYNDVDGGHWAFRYIVSSAAKGWISGYPDGTFRPNSFISRAEAVTIVNRLLERRPDKDYIDTHKPELKPFTDLKPSYWAYYEIYEAVDGHDYNRSFTDIEEHWYRLNNERFVFSQPRYYR